MDIPTGPRGPHRPQQPTAPAPDHGPVQKVPVGQKQIPPGKPLERRPLNEWKIDPFNAPPVIPKPSHSLRKEHRGIDLKDQVLAMLGQMTPDIDPSSVHRVSSEHQQEMAERVARIQKTLNSESIRRAFGVGALQPDLGGMPPDADITLNYVLMLASQVQRAQDDIRAGIEAESGSLQAWKTGLKLFSQLQDVWHDLHPIVTDICSHESVAFQVPVPTMKRMDSEESVDSGVGDLLDLDSPWEQPQSLVSPETVTLPPAAEARISQLEQELGHLRNERTASDRLQQSQEKIEALTRSNQHLVDQYRHLQREVELLRSQPKADPVAYKRLEDQLSQLQNENSALLKQLARERDTLSQKETELSKLQQSLMQQGFELKQAQSVTSIEQQYLYDKQRLEGKIAELENTLSRQVSEISSLKSRIQELEEENGHLSSTVSSQRTEISSLTSTLSLVRQELETKKQEAEHLRDSVKSLQDQLGIKEEEYQQLDRRYQSLLREKTDLEAEKEQTKLQHEQELSDFNQKIQVVTQEKASLEKELEAAQNHENTLTDEVSSLTTERDFLNKRVSELIAENEKLRTDGQGVLNERESTIKTLQESVRETEDQKKKEVEQLEAKVEQIQAGLDKFTKKVVDEKDDFAQALRDFEEKGREAFIGKLEEIETLTAQLEFAKQDKANNERQLLEIHQNELTARDEKERLLQNEITTLTETLTTKKKELDELTLKFEEEKQKLLESIQSETDEKELKEKEKVEAVSDLEGRLQVVASELEKFTKKAEIDSEDFALELENFEEKGRAHFVEKLKEVQQLKADLEKAHTEHDRKQLEAEQNHRAELENKDKTDHQQKEEIELQKQSDLKQKEKIDHLEAALDQKNKELEQARIDFYVEKETLTSTHEGVLKEKVKEIDDLKIRLSELEEESKRTLEEAASKHENELETRNEELVNLTEENQQLKSTVKESVPKAQFAEQQDLTEKAEQKANEALGVVSTLNERLSEKEKELKEKTALVEQFSEKEKLLNSGTTELQDKVEEIKREKEIVDTELTSERATTEELKAQIHDRDVRIEELRSAKETAVNETKQREESHQQALLKQRSEHDEELDTVRNDLQRKLRELEDKLKLKQEQHEKELEAKDEERTKAVDDLKRTLSEEDQEKVKSYEKVLEAQRLDFEKERKALTDSETTLKQSVEKLKQDMKDEADRLKTEFDQEKDELIETHDQALESEKIKVRELKVEAETTAMKVEQERKELIAEHQKAVTALEEAHKAKLTEIDTEHTAAIDKAHTEAQKQLNDAVKTEQEKVELAEAALVKAKEEAEDKKLELVKAHDDEMSKLVQSHKLELNEKEEELRLARIKSDEDLQSAVDAEHQKVVEAQAELELTKDEGCREKDLLVQQHLEALKKKDIEAEHSLNETKGRLALETQEKLKQQKATLDEKIDELEASLLEEKNKLATSTSDLTTQKQAVQQLTEEVITLSSKLQSAEELLTKERDLSSQAQTQLRSTLNDLQVEKEKVDKELETLKDELEIVNDQRTSDREKAEGAKKLLENSIEHLTQEKATLDQQVDLFKRKVADLETLKSSNAKELESLGKERDQLQQTASKLTADLEEIEKRKRTAKPIAIQTEPEAQVRVQAFIGRLGRQRSESGSTSGIFSDEDFSDVDQVAMHSETLYQRPGSTGRGKTVRLESMLESSLKKLRDMANGGDQIQVDIAFKQAFKGIEKQQRELDQELKRLERNEATLVAPDEPPSHSPLRCARIVRYEQYITELEKLREKFQNDVQGSEWGHQKRALELSKAMDDYIDMVNFAISFQRRRETEFQEAAQKFSQLTESEVKTPEGRVSDIHVSLQEVMKHDDDELRNFVAGAYIKKATAEISQKGSEALSQAKGDDIRQTIVRYEGCLKQLTPEMLPLKMGQKLNPLGTRFVLQIVDGAVTKLKQDHMAAPLESDEKAPVRGETGYALAEKMIQNPDIRPAILTLLTSLQTTHEGVETDVDYDPEPDYEAKKQRQEQAYYDASLVGLQRIRDEFRLVDMPTMKELLTYAVHDLKSTNSLLATEAQQRHRQTAVDKRGLSRREKTLRLCQQHLEKENSPDAPQYASCRGQSHDENGELVVHPHRQVLDCFKKGGKVFSASETTTPQSKGPLQVSKLTGVSDGLLNTFFSKAPGGATLVTSERANFQCIQIGSSETQPEDIVFKYNAKAGSWQVNLGDVIWSPDPAFLLNFPNNKMPFEGKKFGVMYRDWIPLKSQNGDTAILALQKIPGHGRYFLYQKGHGDVLVPRVIGSGDPVEERIAAQFFYDAAMASETGEDVASHVGDISLEVKQLRGATAHVWLKRELTVQKLQTLHDEAVQKVLKKPVRCPIPVLRAVGNLSYTTLEESPYRQIQKKKQSKVGVAAGSDISPEHTGSKLGAYNPELFGQFSVDANFDLVGEHYVKKCCDDLKGSDALLREEVFAREKFRREAFKHLTVYKGCELRPEEYQDRSSRTMVEGTPEYSRQVLGKVISVNRDHQMRLAQGLSAESQRLVQEIRSTDSKGELSAYSDDELLDFMILEFEQGNVAAGIPFDSYVRQLTGIMLARNDLEQSARLASKLHKLMAELEQLDRDSELKAKTAEYVQNCQQWNLNMALLATQQDAVTKRLDSYTETTLDAATRARMSFECRVKTVLRENQVEEVGQALGQITHAMKSRDGGMSRISQKGTGWGKSTIVQMLTDHACSQNIGQTNRSVLVIAPESNQAELNITLGRYFAQKGMHYQALDVEKQYVETARGGRWWTAENLDQIYCTMMGLPASCDLSSIPQEVRKPRAPVGVSVKNVQILMQLRSKLQQKAEQQKANFSEADRASLIRLDKIADLVRDSMVFMDEWDRNLMPPGPQELEVVANSVNKALKPLKSDLVKAKSIMQCHGQIVQGCKRKHMLSATVQSGYTAAVASGVTKAEQINEQCHTDVFTTQQRFWHWLNCAKPVYVHLNEPEGRRQMFRQVMDEVGTEREFVVFDGNRKDGKAAEQAVSDFKLLSEERESRGGTPRGVLYYDDQKHLHKYHKGDPVYGAGAPLPKEEEEFIKANRGRDIDVVLTHRESIGTDAPQGSESVGIYMGLLEQKDDGRTSLAAQQMGRMMRASGDLRKPQALYVVVNLDAIDPLPGSQDEKTRFKTAYEAERKALEQVSKAFECSLSELAPEYKELVHKQLQFVPPESESSEGLEVLAEKAMTDEIDRLADEEWDGLGLSYDQVTALKQFKIAQWQAKKAYLLLTAGELARREVSPHTKSCEMVLHKASVESHLDEVYADEFAWLQSSMGGKLEEFSLKQLPFQNEETRGFARRKMINAVRGELQSIPRRTSSGDGNAQRIPEMTSPQPVIQQMTDRVNKLKEDGFDTGAWVDLDDPANCVTVLGPKAAPLSIRQVLVDESLHAFEEARDRTDVVIREFYAKRQNSQERIRPIGIEKIEELRDKLQQKIDTIRQADSAGVDEAIKAQQTIENHYQELMRAISWVGFDNMKVGDNRTCEPAFVRVCNVMRDVVEIEDIYEARAQSVGKINWDSFKDKDEYKGSFLKSVSFQDSVDLRNKEQKKQYSTAGAANVNTVYRLAWKKESDSGKGISTAPKSKPAVRKAGGGHGVEYKDVFISLPVGVRPKAITNHTMLGKIVLEAKQALERQHRSDEAADLCRREDGTDIALFEQCMDQVLQHLLKNYEDYTAKVQEYSREEQERIRQQSQLMQVPMV